MMWIVLALAAASPAAPTAFGDQGRAVVECEVTSAGGLRHCVARSESPEHANVGAFAVKLTRGFRVDLRDPRIKAGKIRIPMQFKMPRPG